MKRFLLTGICLFPFGAAAQVPEIQATATASASAQATGGSPAIVGSSGAAAQIPAGWPPTSAKLPVASVPLDKKATTAVGLSAKWHDKKDTPSTGGDGVLRWIYGNSQPRIVCAPFNYCDIELKPGETINNVRLGDPTFWKLVIGISGGSDGRVTHVAVTPLPDADHKSSVIIYTDQRLYTIDLVPSASKYIAKTGFIYPDAQDTPQDSLANYRAAIGAGGMKKGGPMATLSSTSEGGDNAPIELLKISGDKSSWRPEAAYIHNNKTYIQFPHEMQFGESPSLLGVNDDGGVFSSPTERRIIYRWLGNRIIADTVMEKLKLVLGVGGSQKAVILSREKP